MRKKETRTQKDSSSNFIKISEILRAASHAKRTSPIWRAEVKRRFHLGNRDPEPISVLAGEGDA